MSSPPRRWAGASISTTSSSRRRNRVSRGRSWRSALLLRLSRLEPQLRGRAHADVAHRDHLAAVVEPNALAVRAGDGLEIVDLRRVTVFAQVRARGLLRPDGVGLQP